MPLYRCALGTSPWGETGTVPSVLVQFWSCRTPAHLQWMATWQGWVVVFFCLVWDLGFVLVCWRVSFVNRFCVCVFKVKCTLVLLKKKVYFYKVRNPDGRANHLPVHYCMGSCRGRIQIYLVLLQFALGDLGRHFSTDEKLPWYILESGPIKKASNQPNMENFPSIRIIFFSNSCTKYWKY